MLAAKKLLMVVEVTDAVSSGKRPRAALVQKVDAQTQI